MRAEEAEEQLSRMLDSLTPGTVLHSLAEVLRREAAARSFDAVAAESLRDVIGCLFVVGVGIDAVCPSIRGR